MIGRVGRPLDWSTAAKSIGVSAATKSLGTAVAADGPGDDAETH